MIGSNASLLVSYESRALGDRMSSFSCCVIAGRSYDAIGLSIQFYITNLENHFTMMYRQVVRAATKRMSILVRHYIYIY